MSIEDFKGLMDGFDPAALLPNLDTVLGKLALIARIAVLVGPAAMVIMGLTYLFLSPKEANHYLGYRCYYGMGSVEAWQYTQRLAGICWTALGFLLTVVMALICNSFRGLDTMEMVRSAGVCLLWEIGLILASYIAINVVIGMRFDWKGNRRPGK